MLAPDGRGHKMRPDRDDRRCCDDPLTPAALSSAALLPLLVRCLSASRPIVSAVATRLSTVSTTLRAAIALFAPWTTTAIQLVASEWASELLLHVSHGASRSRGPPARYGPRFHIRREQLEVVGVHEHRLSTQLLTSLGSAAGRTASGHDDASCGRLLARAMMPSSADCCNLLLGGMGAPTSVLRCYSRSTRPVATHSKSSSKSRHTSLCH